MLPPFKPAIALIFAGPGSRLFTSARLSFPLKIILAPVVYVVICALILILPPALNSKFSINENELRIIGSLTVISLFASKITSPLNPVILSASKVTSAVGFSLKALFKSTLSVPPLSMIIFFGSKRIVPGVP